MAPRRRRHPRRFTPSQRRQIQPRLKAPPNKTISIDKALKTVLTPHSPRRSMTAGYANQTGTINAPKHQPHAHPGITASKRPPRCPSRHSAHTPRRKPCPRDVRIARRRPWGSLLAWVVTEIAMMVVGGISRVWASVGGVFLKKGRPHHHSVVDPKKIHERRPLSAWAKARNQMRRSQNIQVNAAPERRHATIRHQVGKVNRREEHPVSQGDQTRPVSPVPSRTGWPQPEVRILGRRPTAGIPTPKRQFAQGGQ